MANLASRIPKLSWPMIATLVRSIFEQADRDATWAQLGDVVDKLTTAGFCDAALYVLDAADDILAFSAIRDAAARGATWLSGTWCQARPRGTAVLVRCEEVGLALVCHLEETSNSSVRHSSERISPVCCPPKSSWSSSYKPYPSSILQGSRP